MALRPSRAGILGLMLWLLCTPLLAADAKSLRLSEVFTDHLVLQREQPLRIWGWGAPGKEVAVTFAEQTVVAKVADDGAWQVELKPLAASSDGRELTVRSEGEALVVRDVLVGEVWLASGQSNMAMTVGDVAKQLVEVEQALAKYNLPSVRFCRIDEGPAEKPKEHLSRGANWVRCSPESVRGYSGVAFFFARRLHEELNVPVGIIDSSRGGTPIEPYIPRAAFVGHPTLERERELGDKDDLAGLTALPGGVFARDANWLPGRLFNSRLAPLAKLRVRGAVWYQGESNCGHNEDPRDYQHKMRALVKGWREAFQIDALPVYYVQLPGSGAADRWPYLREQQRLSADLKDTGMVVTVDLVGGDIHPLNKVDVGERLALWALAKDYGKRVAYSGPMFAKADIQADKVVVHFAHADDGLMVGAKSGLAAPRETADAPLALFELTDASGNWHAAEATIAGKTVVAHSAAVKLPTAVRYGYRRQPDACNLYNRSGLPASPFCSQPELLTIDGK